LLQVSNPHHQEHLENVPVGVTVINKDTQMKKALFSATLLLTVGFASVVEAAQFRVRMTTLCVIETEAIVEAATADEAESLAEDLDHVAVVNRECESGETTATTKAAQHTQVQQ
jgi:hypothetical protein